MIVTCSKSTGALRQLDVAIDLLFMDVDPLAIRTLAGAAHGVLADLVEQKSPGASWRSHLIEDSGLTFKAGMAILNSVQNYLKHADRDPDAALSFDEEENDHILFIATLECCALEHPMSLPMQAFQIWYLASYPEKIGRSTEVVQKSEWAFPDFNVLTRQERLARGAEFLSVSRNEKEENRDAD